MAKITIIYGSTTGNTEAVAQTLANALEATCVNIGSASAADFDADLLVLGSSTWGAGDLQDDWESGIALLDSVDLTGRKVALFGTGDQDSFSDTFVDAIATLRDKVVERGGVIVGQTPVEGYSFSASRAVEGDTFCGLALDDNDDTRDQRITSWIQMLKTV